MKISLTLFAILIVIFIYPTNINAQESISKEVWGQIVDSKYERYAIYDMDRLIFTAMEHYFNSETGSKEEKFYIKMIFNFLVNKHLRLKRAEWELKDIEFNMKLIEKYKYKSQAVNKKLKELNGIE